MMIKDIENNNPTQHSVLPLCLLVVSQFKAKGYIGIINYSIEALMVTD
jgi:hypothetical protein